MPKRAGAGTSTRKHHADKTGTGHAKRAMSELEKARRQRVRSNADRVVQNLSSLSTSDIEVVFGDMPEIVNPKRRDACRDDLERFLRTYKARTYYRPFSPKHQQFIRQLEESMLESMWIVKSMPRGFGKTTLTEGAAEWAIAYGHKKYVRVIGASGTLADGILLAIREEFENNDLLHEDFPEITHAVRALEGKTQRCRTQSFRGALTGIQWSSGELVFPTTIPGAASGGSVVDAVGWTAGLRGARHRLADGTIIRPDFVMVDDPQDDEMATSPATCQKFLDILQGAILGLGGHDARISVVVPATIIKSGDAIDQLMNPKEFPAWIGENIPMLVSEPTNSDLWDGEYTRIRNDYDRNNPQDQRRAHTDATEYYRANRAAMDEGAEATWPECFQRDEISALQHAMNIKIDRGEDYFAAECQGRPTQKLGSGALVTTPEYIAGKLSGLPQRTIAADHSVVTSFIDVAHNKLQWMICGWRTDLSGSILDYGEWPEGNKTLSDVQPQLHAAIRQGLNHLIESIAANPIPCATARVTEAIRPGLILIDCGDPTTRDGVFNVVRSARFPCRVLASRGRAHHQFRVGDGKKKRLLQNALIDRWKSLGPVVVHDACVWRERLQRAMMQPPGALGGIDVYGHGKTRHHELSIQLCAEKLVEKLAGMSGEMFVWNRVPGARNHFLDCAVGCMVGAIVEGLRYGNEESSISPTKRQRAASRPDGHESGPAESPAPARRRGGFRAIDD